MAVTTLPPLAVQPPPLGVPLEIGAALAVPPRLEVIAVGGPAVEASCESPPRAGAAVLGPATELGASETLADVA